MIPLAYTIRNLFRKPLQSIQLIGGSSLVVLLVMLAAAINDSMQRTLNHTGSEKNIILLGAGSEESIERSEVSPKVAGIVSSSLSDIKQVINQAAISPEVHFNGMVKCSEDHEAQTLIRGFSTSAFWVHNKVRILEGCYPRSGEVIIGRLAYQKLGLNKEELGIGQSIEFNGELLKVVGIFDARGTVMEAEIWMPLQDLMTFTQRDSLSCVVLAVESSESFGDAEAFVKTRLDLELVALKESDYYQKLSTFYSPIRWMAWISAILISSGAFFGGLNTLYAVLAARIREFGTLQAIGFSRKAILFSLFQEGISIGVIASIVSISFGLLFIQGYTFPFSIGVFTLDINNTVSTTGLLVGIILGVIGIIPPAWKSLRPSLPQTLRSS